jgi:hypothetical protein
MTWLKLDDKFVRHPKVQGLSDSAFRLHMAAMGHCAEYATDGRVKSHVVATLTAHPDKAPLVKEMVDAGLWEEMVGGWEIHDFLQYNPSAEQIKTRRKEWRERQDKRRESRRDTERESERDSLRESGTGTGSGSDPEGSAEGRPKPSEAAAPGQDAFNSVTEWVGGTSRERGTGADVAITTRTDAVASGGSERPVELVDRVWRELWEAKYRRPYETSGRFFGPDSEDMVQVRVAEMASIRVGREEAYLRHKFVAYLRDKGDRDYLVNRCHPFRLIERDWAAYGEPKEPKRMVPRREEPVELVSVEEMAARAAAAMTMPVAAEKKASGQ